MHGERTKKEGKKTAVWIDGTPVEEFSPGLPNIKQEHHAMFDNIYIYIYIYSIHRLRRLVAGFPSQRSGFESRSCNVDKVVLGLVFSEYFGFPYQLSFHRLLHTHHHLSSEGGTIDQIVADVASGLTLTAPRKKKYSFHIFS
jgi:hypothetical protein